MIPIILLQGWRNWFGGLTVWASNHGSWHSESSEHSSSPITDNSVQLWATEESSVKESISESPRAHWKSSHRFLFDEHFSPLYLHGLLLNFTIPRLSSHSLTLRKAMASSSLLDVWKFCRSSNDWEKGLSYVWSNVPRGLASSVHFTWELLKLGPESKSEWLGVSPVSLLPA